MMHPLSFSAFEVAANIVRSLPSRALGRSPGGCAGFSNPSRKSCRAFSDSSEEELWSFGVSGVQEVTGSAYQARSSERRRCMFALASRASSGFDGSQLPIVGPSLISWTDMRPRVFLMVNVAESEMASDNREGVKAARINSTGAVIGAIIGAMALLVAALLGSRSANQEAKEPVSAAHTDTRAERHNSGLGPEETTDPKEERYDGIGESSDPQRPDTVPFPKAPAETTHPTPTHEVVLVLPPAMEGAEVRVDGRSPIIVRNIGIFVTIRVPGKDSNHHVEVRKGERVCSQDIWIGPGTSRLQPCG